MVVGIEQLQVAEWQRGVNNVDCSLADVFRDSDRFGLSLGDATLIIPTQGNGYK